MDPLNDLTATITSAIFAYGPKATVATLASPNINDENNPKNPKQVAITQRTEDVGKGSFDLKFPKHSVTAIKLSR